MRSVHLEERELVSCRASSWGLGKPTPFIWVAFLGDSLPRGRKNEDRVGHQCRMEGTGQPCESISSAASCPDFMSEHQAFLLSRREKPTYGRELVTCLFGGQGIMKSRPCSHYGAKDDSELHPLPLPLKCWVTGVYSRSTKPAAL